MTWGLGTVAAAEVLHLLLELFFGVIVALLLPIRPAAYPTRAWQVLPPSLLTWTVLLLGGAAYLRARGADLARAVPIRPTRPVPRGLIPGAIVAIAFVIPLIALPDVARETPLYRLIRGPADRIALAFFALVVAPIAEELYYRGFVYAGVVRSLGVVPAVLGVGLWFGLIHAPEYWGAPWGIASLCAMGIATTWLRWRTGGVGPCIAAHFVFNAVGVIGIFLEAG